MEYDSPEAAKEFPGLYMADAGHTLEDSIDYDDEEKQKKRKEKKDKKEKGYAALAGESSPEEEEAEPKSPGKLKKIKPFKLSSTKKKDKTKSLDKADKVTMEETKKPLEKSKSLGGEKEKKVTEKDKKTLERERNEEKKAAEKQKKEEKKLDKEREKKKEKEEKERKKEEKKKKSLSGESGVNMAGGVASPSTVEKERGLNLNQALNAFLNAPAPRLIKRDKDEKKSKERSSSILKLKRSKHSLDESHSGSDVPITVVSHQFPEEPEAISKEIKKYEALLEQTHSQIKSSKKVSKKSEEQLWELQRTLTQLKRKLRSVNALKSTESHPTSSTSSLHPESQHSHTDASDSHSPQSKSSQGSDQVDGTHIITEPTVKAAPVPVSMSPTSPKVTLFPEVTLDFTQMVASADTFKASAPLPPPTVLSTEDKHNLEEVDLKRNLQTSKDYEQHPRRLSEHREDSHLASISPEPDVEKMQVQVEVHATNVSPMFSLSDVEDNGSLTPDSQMGSSSAGRVFRTLTFSEDDDDDEVDEVTDISTLSPKNVQEFSRDNRQAIANSLTTVTTDDPFQMPIFETEEYLAMENKAISQFNERLRKEIASEESDIDTLMEQLVLMGNEGVDIDAPEIELDLDRFDNDELLSLWQITKLENEALNERVDQLRQMVAVSKLEEFRLETRVRYLENLHSKIQQRKSSTSS